MSARFIIDSRHRVVFSQAVGVFHYADYLDHMSRLVADSGFIPEYDHFVDCRACTLDLSSYEVQDLASRSVFNKRSRRVFVVSTDYQFGLSRMFAAYREINAGQEIMVFKEWRDALVWLGLPPELDPFPQNESTNENKNA
jgi:hypothetical protein